MTQEHPITPPPELVHEWQIKIEYASRRADREALVSKVFQLGADYELEACCEWVSAISGKYGPRLRMSRRPKPPSLKERALQELDLLTADATTHGLGFDASAIRCAIESIPDEQ